MIGMILVGHGNFSSGLSSSVELIAGKQEHYIAIDFVQEITPDQLEEMLEDAISSLEDCKSVVIFTDILGGTPFKTAAQFVDERVKLVGGVNLPILIEFSMTRSFNNDCDLISKTLESGKNQIVEFQLIRQEEEEF